MSHAAERKRLKRSSLFIDWTARRAVGGAGCTVRTAGVPTFPNCHLTAG